MILIAYLASVPLPAIIMKLLGITLYYEELSFWLISLYMAPLWLVAEPLGAATTGAMIALYWVILTCGVLIWHRVWGRRRTGQPL